MSIIYNSEWTKFLDSSYKDPYQVYKEKIAIQCEEMIASITKELMDSNQPYTPQIAKEMAVNVVMQQMIEIQYQNSPEIQKAMVTNLFLDLPQMKNFQKELLNKAVQKTTFIDVLKNKFLSCTKKTKLNKY